MHWATFKALSFFIKRLVSMTDASGLDASLSACWRARALASPGGTMRLIRPSSSAVSAVIGSPSIKASAARTWPIRRGTSRLEAASGHKPRFTNGMENAALSPAYTKSQCSSIVVPIPTAGPHTLATTGLAKLLMPRKKRNTGASGLLGGIFKKSAISLPAEKIVSCP